MNDSTRRPWWSSALAVASLVVGSWTSAAFVFGVGVGDTAIINPVYVTPLAWTIPAALFAFPFVFFGRRLARQRRIGLRDALAVLVVVSVIAAIVAPFWREHELMEYYRRQYEEQSNRESSQAP